MPPSPEGPALSVAADYASVRLLADHLRDACSRAALDDGCAFELELAMVEAANNVVEHGYAGAAGGTMALAVAVEDNVIRAVLTDGGTPAPDGFFAKGTMPPPGATGGRGAGIIRGCVDEIHYETGASGNRLVLTKRCPHSAPVA